MTLTIMTMEQYQASKSKHINEREHIILDWAGNLCFNGKTFKTFEDADEFLSEFFEKHNLDYEEERGEYYIQERE